MTYTNVIQLNIFLISKNHYIECVSDQFGIIKASESIGGIVLYHFISRKNNAIPIKFSQILAYTSHELILESKINDLKRVSKYIPEPALKLI